MLDKSKINYQYLEDTLLNTSGKVPLAERFRTLFTLKNIADDKAVDIMAKTFNDKSALLKHEVAYCIGQTGNPHANKILEEVLADPNQHVMVRHEAAEAMGALGFPEFLPILEKYSKECDQAIVDTCVLAIDRINYVNDPANKKENEYKSAYSSVDPAPPTLETKDVQVLGQELIDPNLSLFKRYRAMFALREIGTTEAVLALCEGLKDKTSALFRHEVAYVLGQMQNPASVPALTESLKNKEEVHMVRHEAAEALGSVASPEVFEVLNEFKNDPEQVVAESCIVALDMFEYENSGAFQYADSLEKQNMHSLKLATGY
ncbi:armadillo-type protein [Cokeromyces recurvatus]|uniref:armadillo-type protein n=1 Tax=Cokeromyces recurvatus TaxID=90255 RepID=UPI00221EF7D4|nr:armadillo-type protein [Cokeromyces recurvatus]KAI7905499.1 armadillo-type protein [Cokeromyces recurvatus]